MSEPDRLDQFIVALDALYARREVLTARLDHLTQAAMPAQRSAQEHEEIKNIQRERSEIGKRIASLKEQLESRRTATD